MKLKDSTFAIIAEKQNSISHKWFNQNIKNNKHKQHVFWCHEKEYYIYDKGNFIRCTENRPKDIPIYTESEFEALLKAEQKNEAKADYSKKAYGTYVGGVNGVFMASPGQITPLTAKSNSNIEVEPQTFPVPKGDGNITLEGFSPLSNIKDPVKSTESNQVIITYQTAIDLLAYYTKIDKGIIKIEMPCKG